MNHDTWKLLDAMFEETPGMKAAPVPYAEIDKLSSDFGFSLPESYREFVHRYGGATVGQFSIFGVGASNTMGNDEASVFEVTNRFIKDGWVGVENWLIISMDHSGNPVGLDANGVVWISDHDHGCVDKLADNFEGYIREWCLEIGG